MLEKVKEAFDNYISTFDTSIKEIALKYNHSYAVCDLMGELAFRLDLDKEKIELAKVIGLLHDIGRFRQLTEYNSFEDSNLDHAKVGVDYLFKEKHIRDFIEDDKYDEIIKTAIKYHNKLKLPKLDGDLELFSKMIRDMDKVDIYKQVATKYEIVFDSKELNKSILKDFRDNKSIDHKKVKSETDVNMEMLSYIFDINFEESFDILVQTDNFDLYLSMVNVAEDSEKLWNKVREVCFDKINRGVGD